MAWKLHIERVADSIAIKRTNDNGATYTPVTYHNIAHVTSIIPDGVMNFAPRLADNNRKFNYNYTNKLRVSIMLENASSPAEVFDIQDVINQATWTANLSGLNVAVADINSWLVPS